MMLPEELRLRHRAGTGFRHAAGVNWRVNTPSLAASSSSSVGEIVRRSQPASAGSAQFDGSWHPLPPCHSHGFVILINLAHRDHARIAVHLIG